MTRLSKGSAQQLFLSSMAPQACAVQALGQKHSTQASQRWICPNPTPSGRQVPSEGRTARQGGVLTAPCSANGAGLKHAAGCLITKDTHLKSDSSWVTAVRSKAKLFFESFISSDVSCQPFEGFPQKLPHSLCSLSILWL